jgi:hypothetical protein
MENNVRKLQEDFSRHVFFTNLKENKIDWGRLIPALSCWVFLFPDVLRINQAQAISAETADLLSGLRNIDTSHQKWLLHDQQVLNGCQLGHEYLVDDGLALVRDASFDILWEARQARQDVERMALVEALEAGGEVFFDRTELHFSTHPSVSQLKYFAGIHATIERYHADEMRRWMAALFLNAAEMLSANQMRERIFNCFHHLFDGLNACSAEPTPQR